MKKIVLSIAFVGLLTSTSFAQRSHKNPIQTGLKAGANMSTFMGGYTQEFKPGLQIGGTVEIPLSYYKKFALQTELLYSVQGYKGAEYDQIDLETDKVTETLKLEDVTTHYLYLPITVKYYVSDNFSLELGGQVGYMLHAKGQFDVNKYNTAREYLYFTDPNFNIDSDLEKALFEAGYRSKDPDNYYERLDFGVIGGFNYHLENGIYFNFRYYFGLKDVYKIDNDYKNIEKPTNPVAPGFPPISEEAYKELTKEVDYVNEHLKFDPIRNTSIQISIGYKF